MSIIKQYFASDTPITLSGPAIINFSIEDKEQSFLQALYGDYLQINSNNKKYQQYYTTDQEGYPPKSKDPFYIMINNEKIRLGKSGMYESSYFIQDSNQWTITVPETPPASLKIDVIEFYS